jgi:hydroxyacylglutathione hydrolase
LPLQALPALQDNYIWALSTDTGRALIVDPGEAGPVLEAARQGLTPVAVLLTHHHNDHIGGTAALLQRWPDMPVVAPHDERITTATLRVGDGDRVPLEGWQFDVIALPGHTLTHIAFYLASDGRPAGPLDRPSGEQEQGVLFCGDTLFSLGCGRLFEGTPPQMAESLARLAALPGDTRVCCGHEYTLANAAFARVVEPDNPAVRRRTEEAKAMRDAGQPTLPSTLASELACNPFLRCDQPAVTAAVAQRLGRLPIDEVETFAELRRWKDGFRA